MTRKSDEYVLPTSTFGAEKSRLRVAASIRPTSANSAASVTAIQASALGSQLGEGSARDGGGERGERQQEEGERVTARLEVGGPEERERRVRDERSGRYGDRRGIGITTRP